MPLTSKQEKFVKEYMLDKNAMQAAFRAGYGKTEKSAGSIGRADSSENTKNVEQADTSESADATERTTRIESAVRRE